MPPKAKKTRGEVSAAAAAKAEPAAEVVQQPAAASTATPNAPVTAAALLATPRRSLPAHSTRAAAAAPWTAPRYRTRADLRDFRVSQVPSQVRTIHLYAPDLEPSAPIRLPELPQPRPQTPPTPAADAAQVTQAPAAVPSSAPIKLREGWGYKIGATRFRAVFDPTRKAIPKLPERAPGGYEVLPTTMTGGGAESKPPVCLFVNSFVEPAPEPDPVPTQTPFRKNKKPGRKGDYYVGIDRDAAAAVKKCYDERMAEEASSSSSSSPPVCLGALVRITSVEESGPVPDEHGYTQPNCVHTAEIVTTFPLDQLAHYRKKKYKEDHVVIDSGDPEEIFKRVHRIRHNKRRWRRVVARCEEDEEYARKQREKKLRGYAAEKAKLAAMPEEERKAINIRKYAHTKAKRLLADPEQSAKKQRLEERRAANLAKNKALLAAGIDDPEERRRLQRRIRKAEQTPEERREAMLRDLEYQRRKKELLANATPAQLAVMEEEKRLKKEKRAALAGLTPKQRMRAQQREYEANYKAKKHGKDLPKSKTRRLSKRAKVEEKEEEEEEDLFLNVDDDFGFDDEVEVGFDEENEMAVQGISSPLGLSPLRHPLSSRLDATPRHRYARRQEDDDDDVIESVGEPSSASLHRHQQLQYHLHSNRQLQPQPVQQQRFSGYVEMAGPSSRSHHYSGDLEAELLSLQKEVVWADRAIGNSRAEAERLRAEASALDAAVDEEVRAQVDRRRRIARLTAIWREDHGEDSQG